MGVTFSEYMLNYRLSLAKRMLEEGNISLVRKYVGVRILFPILIFLTAFRQKYDMSPGAWHAAVKSDKKLTNKDDNCII